MAVYRRLSAKRSPPLAALVSSLELLASEMETLIVAPQARFSDRWQPFMFSQHAVRKSRLT